MSKLEKRLIWIDIAKGIGLFLVILGHMPSLPEWFRLWIFSFHMPLFFFLSGYTSKSSEDTPLVIFLKKAIKRYLLPYYLYSGIVILFKFICVNTDSRSVQDILYDTFIGQGGNHILWFFFAMFWINIISYAINRCVKVGYSMVLSIFLYVVFCFLAHYNIPNVFKIMSAGIGLIYYQLGQFCDDKTIKKILSLKSFVIMVVINVLGSAIVIINFGLILDINFVMIHNCVISSIIAVCGVGAVCCVSNYMEMIMEKKNSLYYPIKYIQHVGQNTFYFFPITAIVPSIVMSITNGETVRKLE